MKRSLIISGIVVLGAVIGLIIFNRAVSAGKNVSLYTKALSGKFEVTVNASGELIAEKSVEIKGPVLNQQPGGGPGRGMDMRNLDLKIQDLVPEGTIVNAGDYVAQLDRTNYDNTLKDEYQNLSTLTANLELKILDTTVTLTSLRDDIKNQTYSVEEARIVLDESKYEPPATIRKAQLDLDKQKRALEQLRKTYDLKAAQTLADINQVKQTVTRKEKLVKDLQEYLAGFTIKAPSPGMVIYKKNMLGSKTKTGSSLNIFDMVVATLPDLSVMLSKIYVSEIEVANIKTGMTTDVGIDALQGKTYKGKIISIANVGEELPNSDAKMFETQIRLDGTNPELRPSMTTSNKILVKSIPGAVYIPTECIQAGADSIPFVYTKSGTKRVVLLGASNDKFTVVEKGLDAGTQIYVVPPAKPEKFRITNKELIPAIRQRELTAIVSK
ncbi:MAG TPA: HlyD family efflux transporter periplasmic adaptor subunit [Bacteroidales bacterium]|nr:HlyD family efflux transporter periplasmic adaptor subunit [Bacteroidales bacterium]